MRRLRVKPMRVLCGALPAVVALAGCASRPLVPAGAVRIATHVTPGSEITIPAGTKGLYYVQRGPMTVAVTSIHDGPTTQLVTLPVFMLVGSSKQPVDVYVTR